MSNQVSALPSQNCPSETDSTESLIPTTTTIIDKCPRTRILIVGRSGVGKSSLVNAIFKTSFALVKGDRAGEAEITKEYISEHNDRFVLHDSQGYEPGDKKKFAVLENFIKAKTSPSIPLSERLHAIWLCIPVSFAGGRIFERGDENIFKLEHGKVPIIVVFTQFDLLSVAIRRSNATDDDEKLKKLVDETFDKQCVQPFKVLIQGMQAEPPFAAVSVRQTETLQTLVDITIDHIEKIPHPVDVATPNTQAEKRKKKSFFSRFKNVSLDLGKKASQSVETINSTTSALDAATSSCNTLQDTESAEDTALVMAMAQRTNADPKVVASIKVGKKKYWRAIASGVNFMNLRLSSCLKVIHIDIVNVWNIRGLNEYLLDDTFRGCMTKVVQDLSNLREDGNLAQGALGAAGASAGIAAVVAPAIIAGPAAAVAAPVAVVIFFAAWALAVYRKSPEVIGCLMAYVVDLIIIMRTVFEASLEDKDGIVQKERVSQIVEEFDKSEGKKDIHNSIRGFVQEQNLFAKTAVLEKIESLIRGDRTLHPS